MINELRIGNWIEAYPGGYVQVVSLPNELGREIMTTPNFLGATHGSIYHPIPLTPQVLEKCGFKNTEYNVYKKGKFEFYKDHTTGTSYYPGLPPETATKFKYVHQLQNLHFAITNEELIFQNIKELRVTDSSSPDWPEPIIVTKD